MRPERMRYLPLVSRVLSFVLWPFLKAFNRILYSRFPSPSASPPPGGGVDDGRYDYGLSQPVYGIILEKGVFIPTRDGTRLKADIFRPDAPGRFPVIMAEAPYPRYIKVQPGVDDTGGVGTRYQQFEQANPEYWVPRGYVYISYSSRGYQGSEGIPTVLDLKEAEDGYDAVEWAAAQPWSNGKVGLFGISYYAMFQYWVAGLTPPHLAAIVPWEGLADPYRDIAYRGGIPCMFGVGFALGMQILANNPFKAPNFMRAMLDHPFCDDLWNYGIRSYRTKDENTPSLLKDFDRIQAPMLSVGNLNDPDLHLRGNVFAFTAAGSRQKKLLLYSGTHWGSAYQPWANRTVLRFFDHYLKGVDTGLEDEPAVDVQLRTGADTFTHVYGNSWPLEDTVWTRFHLDARERSLGREEPSEESFAEAVEERDEGGSSRRVTFLSPPLQEDLQVAGPVTAHLWVSSSTRDVDITVELRDFDPRGVETRFPYVIAGMRDEPVTRGWLRASHRALDPERTLPHRPWHLHAHNDWLTPGEPVALDVELWPTSMVFKAGHRIGLTVHCGPYRRRGEVYFHGRILPFLPPVTLRASNYQAISPEAGTTRIHTGGERQSWLELPVIPAPSEPVHQVEIDDRGFKPEEVCGLPGDRFSWANAGEDYHSVTESSGLRLWDSQLIRGRRSHNPETWWTRIPWAGTFYYQDMVAGFGGRVAVPVKVGQLLAESGGARVEVVLGTAPPPKGTGFDVQLLREGEDWKTVREGVTEERPRLGPLPAGRYSVRSRLRRLEGEEACTGWSPPVEFEVP